MEYLLHNRRRCERCEQKTSWRHFSSVDVAPRKISCTFFTGFIQKKTLSTQASCRFFIRKNLWDIENLSNVWPSRRSLVVYDLCMYRKCRPEPEVHAPRVWAEFDPSLKIRIIYVVRYTLTDLPYWQWAKAFYDRSAVMSVFYDHFSRWGEDTKGSLWVWDYEGMTINTWEQGVWYGVGIQAYALGIASLRQTTNFYPRMHRPQINAKYCLTMFTVVYPRVLNRQRQKVRLLFVVDNAGNGDTPHFQLRFYPAQPQGPQTPPPPPR
jgi:hypothetical protein